MIEQQSKSDALFGFIFITGVFVFTFLLIRGMTVSSAPEASTPLSEINILYLVDESKVPNDSNRYPTTLSQSLDNNIQVVNTSTEAIRSLTSDNLAEIDVLIVDQSALSFVAPNEIAGAYNASVVVFGLNIPITQFSNLINDKRVLADNFAADPYPGDYFIYAFQSVTSENPNEGAQVDQAARKGSDEPLPGIEGVVYSSFSRGQNTLDTQQDLDIFTAVLTTQASDRP